jgi:alkylation response protein AidB-like acyl-CoA dehydrogenase
MLLVSALEDSADGKLIIAAVPTQRAGIRLFEDWDNMGQRQTDSGSAVFERVAVAEDEILADPGPCPRRGPACGRCWRSWCSSMLPGHCRGRLRRGAQYTRTQARLWPASPAGE